MLKAEEDGLIDIVINAPDEAVEPFCESLVRCVQSKNHGETAVAWDVLRKEICETAVTQHLVPAASKWAKEHLKGLAEEFVSERCRMELEFRVNVRPYADVTMEQGDTPSVMALTNGHGGVKDAVMTVMLDDEGNIRTQTKFDNLKDEADRDTFIDIVQKRQPSVIVVGGMSVQAARLKDDISAALRLLATRRSGENAPVSEAYASHEEFMLATADFDARIAPLMVPLTYVNDATAKIYMTSEEAATEHPGLPLNGRYALGLARYTQNPLNAYCKLGRSISAITFMEHHQKLVSRGPRRTC